MAHYEIQLDVGYDYGADGGHAWMTVGVEDGAGRFNAYELWQDWLGTWQLGNRTIDKARLDYLRGFNASMRGKAHTFLWRDYNDWTAKDELLTVSGATTQLVKTYSAGGTNPYVRSIVKPEAGSVTITKDGAAYTAWTLDTTTGLVTWTGGEPTGVIRWSGRFFCKVRFNEDAVNAQFLAYEDRGNGVSQAVYQMGQLSVREERGT